MEKMYIYKHGRSYTIGDTITGNTGLGEGHQFLWMNFRDAEKRYREIYGLKGKRFRQVMVNRSFFYIY